MFVRAKLIKGKPYGYLVENEWVKGKVKQVTKKYLGRIYQPKKIHEQFAAISEDFDKKSFIIELIAQELQRHGFVKHERKQAYVLDTLEVHLLNGIITANGKKAVLQLNDRYVYAGNLQRLLDFYEPESEDDRPGTRLAAAFSDIGVAVQPQDFVTLYRKIY